MDKSITDLDGTRHWKHTLREQGRTLRWLAKATGFNPRTVYAYSSGQLPATAEFLARASEALGEEVSA